MTLIIDLKRSHKPPPPCSDEMAPVPGPKAKLQKDLVLIYYDESIFNTNEGQKWMWATDDTPVIQPKTKGSGITVSDFVNNHNGYLQLTDEEYAVAKVLIQICNQQGCFLNMVLNGRAMDIRNIHAQC